MDLPRLHRVLPSLLSAAAVGVLAVAVGVVALAERDPAPAHSAHGTPGGHDGHTGGTRSVAALTGPRDGVPDVRFELTARRATLTLDGLTVDALTFDGTAPGPELRMRAGQLVEVVLRNADVTEGVTLHWHGLDVPNAEDGVAGVTQDAVPPGGEHVYRFRPDQVGTFWYHSHQDSARTVHRGLYGALVVEPPRPAATSGLDTVLLGHSWTRDGRDPLPVIGTATGPVRRDVPAGTRVRARLVNTDSTTQEWTVAGAPFTVVAIDGVGVHGPTPLAGERLRIPGGGRLDVEFTAPATVGMPGGPAVGFGSDPVALDGIGPVLDPLHYGSPAPPPFDPAGPFDRDLVQVLDTVRTVQRGVPGVTWTINGELHPPAQTVAEGELVRVTVRNDGTDPHPMHLHGHHVLLLSRNGIAATGSPWWTDTLGVERGETFEVAFRADNPGIWMDHCHNLTHAAAGMVLHLAYAGVSTPFAPGGGSGNLPE